MMKLAVVFIALLLVVSSSQLKVSPLGQERFVEMQGNPYEAMMDLTPSKVKSLNLPVGASDLPACKPGHPDYFKFLGITVAHLTEATPSAEHETPCFKNTKYTLKWLDAQTAKISFTNTGKKNVFCADHYLATTLISFDIHTNWMWWTNSVTYKFKTAEEAQYARTAGISVLLMCDSWLNMIPDMIKTASLFLVEIIRAKQIPVPQSVINYLYKNAIDFVTRYTGIKLTPRTQRTAISEEYIRKYVQSGDVLVLRSPSGMASLIFYSTGGPVSHAAIAMWEGDKLWILEANDLGLVRMELEDWYKKYDSDIAWLHLSEANRARFDADAAWEWFRSVENMAYGINNFLFTMLDDPLHNFDYITDINSAILMFKQLDLLAPGVLDQIMVNALNIRLGTSGLKFTDILYEAQRQGTNIIELLKIPEKDGWLYNGQQDYVCSCLAIKMLEQGGLFDGLNINSHEFTPRDVFMIGLYNNDPANLPELCQSNDPTLPYCQMKGKYLIEPTLYNTIKPYSHMNDNCPSMPPNFYRPSNC